MEIAIIRRLGEECKSSLGLSFYSVLSFEPSKSLCLIKLSTFKTHSGCSGASSCREKRSWQTIRKAVKRLRQGQMVLEWSSGGGEESGWACRNSWTC